MENRIVIAVICIAAGSMQGYAAHGERAFFSAQVEADTIGISSELRFAQDVPYVSLNELLQALGGAVRVMPDRVQVNWRGGTAVLSINNVAVSLPGLNFALVYPARVQDDTAYIALADVSQFFLNAYQTPVSQVEQARMPAELTPVVPEQVLLDEDEEMRELLLDALEPAPAHLEEDVTTAPDEYNDADDMLEALPDAADAADDSTADTTEPPVPMPADAVLDAETLARIGAVIALDPGHGGQDAGIPGGAGPSEKDLTLDIALRIRRILKETTAISVHLTRDTDKDVPPVERAAIAGLNNCDVLISLHMGYSASARSQGMVLFTDQPIEDASSAISEERGARIAARHRNAEQAATYAWHMAQALQADNELIPVFLRSAPLLLQRESDIPCVLIEVAYMSNNDTVAALNDDTVLEQMAHTLALGIATAMHGR